MPKLTVSEIQGKQYRELAATIADQAQAIADRTLSGPRYAVASLLLLSNAKTLFAWTPDDQSGTAPHTLHSPRTSLTAEQATELARGFGQTQEGRQS
jgi:hypothetical protein